MKSKIIQINTTAEGKERWTQWALCEDGSIWERIYVDGWLVWVKTNTDFVDPKEATI